MTSNGVMTSLRKDLINIFYVYLFSGNNNTKFN